MNGGVAARRSLFLVLAVTLPLLALRLCTPYELQQTDQARQAQYALDVVQNGNWLAPGSLGVAATKPPLYTWLAGLVSRAAGRIDETTIRVPTVLAALGLVLATWDIARRLAGPRVAAAAAIALATSHHFVRLSGVVRTDGLLAFLLAAQMLVHVRSLGAGAMPFGGVVASAALAAAACLAKGPAGLVSCAAVALHLAATGCGRRAWLSAGVPAVAGAAVLGAWFVAALETRGDVYDTMVGKELGRHVAGEGWPNPFYYVIHGPPRLSPWVLLLAPAAWFAWRSVRRRDAEPVAPLVSVALAWAAAGFAAFSFLPHQRPDLIYPAEPALLLLVAALIDRPFPAWAPRAVAALLGACALLVATPLARRFVAEDAPPSAFPAGAALFAAAAGAVLWLERRDAAVACFTGLAAFGLADALHETLGRSAQHERASYRRFGETARHEASVRGARLAAIGFDKPAPLFDLRISARPLPAEYFGGAGEPLLVVTTPQHFAAVERVLGPCDVIASHAGRGSGRVSLVLAAPR